MPVGSLSFPDLTTDCSACAALCCIALHFDQGDDFAIDKAAGVPCHNLAKDSFDCKIHDGLIQQGFGGCVAFDCLGAGQYTIQTVFGGITWRSHPELLPEMMEVFRILRRLHQALEILKYLSLLPLSEEQERLVALVKSSFDAPEDGWTLATLSALETEGAFDLYNTALPAFQSLFSDRNALAALRPAT